MLRMAILYPVAFVTALHVIVGGEPLSQLEFSDGAVMFTLFNVREATVAGEPAQVTQFDR
jgi:hypothetical protein